MNVSILTWQQVLQDVACCDSTAEELNQAHAEMNAQRATLCKDYPFSIILALAYPQMDFANRWCWQQFGSPQGRCDDHQSEYPSCNETTPNHHHEGRWRTHWWEKLDYDFGYNEWFFAEQMDYEAFYAFIPHISFGEHYDEGTDQK